MILNASRKVLVVEDDDDCRFVYGEFLRAAGFESFEVDSADRAKAWLSSVPTVPSLVILDLTLPGMPTSEFVSWLRQDPHFVKTKLLVLSGRHDIADQARALGADGFVKKPCDLGPLTEEVSRLTTVSSSP